MASEEFGGTERTIFKFASKRRAESVGSGNFVTACGALIRACRLSASNSKVTAWSRARPT